MPFHIITLKKTKMSRCQDVKIARHLEIQNGKNGKRQKILQKRFGNLDYFHYLCKLEINAV